MSRMQGQSHSRKHRRARAQPELTEEELEELLELQALAREERNWELAAMRHYYDERRYWDD